MSVGEIWQFMVLERPTRWDFTELGKLYVSRQILLTLLLLIQNSIPQTKCEVMGKL